MDHWWILSKSSQYHLSIPAFHPNFTCPIVSRSLSFSHLLFLSPSISLFLCFPSLPLIVEIYRKDRPECIIRAQELFANNGSHVLSFFLSIYLSRSFLCSLSPSHSFAPSPLLRSLSFSLSLPVLEFIRDRTYVSRHRHSPRIGGSERIEPAHGPD